jgi:hypothetical protein
MTVFEHSRDSIRARSFKHSHDINRHIKSTTRDLHNRHSIAIEELNLPGRISDTTAPEVRAQEHRSTGAQEHRSTRARPAQEHRSTASTGGSPRTRSLQTSRSQKQSALLAEPGSRPLSTPPLVASVSSRSVDRVFSEAHGLP